jgi:DNA-binding beta-propeller fold protein YncE
MVHKTLTPVIVANRDGTVVITPDGQFVFVTDPSQNTFPFPLPGGLVTILRISDDRVDGYVENTFGADDMVVSSSGKFAYVSFQYNCVSAIDIPNRQVIKSFEFISYGGLIIPITLGPKP